MSVDYRVYVRARDSYLSNAERLASRGEIRKASELLWGAVAQSIKAVAARRGHRIESHRQLLTYARELARETGDQELYKQLLLARILHENFYDETLDPTDFEIIAREAYRLIAKLDRILKSLEH